MFCLSLYQAVAVGKAKRATIGIAAVGTARDAVALQYPQCQAPYAPPYAALYAFCSASACKRFAASSAEITMFW